MIDSAPQSRCICGVVSHEDNTTMITPITLSSTLSSTPAEALCFLPAGTWRLHPRCRQHRENVVSRRGGPALTECFRYMCTCGDVDRSAPDIKASLLPTHAAPEYRRKQKTLLMSCFNLCKSCQAGQVLWSEDAVGLPCCVDSSSFYRCIKYK